MATNNLTPKQDLLIRNLYAELVEDINFLADHPSARRNTVAMCLQALNYNVVGGSFISRDKPQPSGTYGSQSSDRPVCEWAADTAKAEKEFNETNNPTSGNQADSSVEAPDTEVREAVLREDV